MLEQISGQYDKRQKMMSLVEQAEQMVNKYGWENREVHPWRYPMKVTEILQECKDYDQYTYNSKEMLVDLINGLVPILNAWEEYELVPKIEVRSLRTGKVYKIREEDLELFEGEVEAI